MKVFIESYGCTFNKADAQIMAGVLDENNIELTDSIEQSDVISFDLFDTRIMRQTYAPEDVARYVECRLQEKGIFFENF